MCVCVCVSVCVCRKQNYLPCLANLYLSAHPNRLPGWYHSETLRITPALLPGPPACPWPLPKLTGFTLTCAVIGYSTDTWCPRDGRLHQLNRQVFHVFHHPLSSVYDCTLLLLWFKTQDVPAQHTPHKSWQPKHKVGVGAEVHSVTVLGFTEMNTAQIACCPLLIHLF
jgi:hypothetical protein